MSKKTKGKALTPRDHFDRIVKPDMSMEQKQNIADILISANEILNDMKFMDGNLPKSATQHNKKKKIQ